jgi:transcriptional regulator with XRE-family HTH domain
LPTPEQIEVAESLARLAGIDLATAEKLAPDPEMDDRPVGFHAQQAIEKALKVALVLEGIDFPKTHDLEVAKHFGLNLRRLRKEAKLSQEQLGQLASLHRTEIGLLERGARIPRIDTIVKLAAALVVPPDRLLIGIEWTPGTAEAGTFTISSRIARHNELMERAAELRARQKEPVDAVKLVHEAREELARRSERWKEDENDEEEKDS